MSLLEKCEEWKPVVDYEGVYEISNKGQIRSLGSYVDTTNNIIFKPGKILKTHKDKKGYLRIKLRDRVTKKIHRLVCEAFLDKQIDMQVNHKDMNKENNCIDNLEWCTNKQNQDHRNLNNPAPRFNLKKRKISDEKILSMATFSHILNDAQVCRVFNVDRTTIGQIRKGITYSEFSCIFNEIKKIRGVL